MQEIDDARALIAAGKLPEAADALRRVAAALEPDLSWQEEKVLAIFSKLKLDPSSEPLAGGRLSPLFADAGIADADSLKGLGDAVAKGRLEQVGHGYVLTDAGYEHIR